MRILHTPNNVASFPTITSDALNKIEGITSAVVLFGSNSKYHHKGENVSYIHFRKYKVYNPSFWFNFISGILFFIREIYRADVIHYYWNSAIRFNLDLKIIKLLKKPLVIEWLGSDIRTPERMFALNPYYEIMYNTPGFEYRNLESAENSAANQQKFKVAGAVPVVCPEIGLYLDHFLFPEFYTTNQRINLNQLVPEYPQRTTRPLIIHSPTAPVAKGSKYIIETMERLSARFDFEFRIISGVSREEANQHMQECDIFIDQLMYGAYGMATVEAMAYGKPVLCYLMPRLQEILPPDTPIVNVNIDTLEGGLVRLLESPELRTSTGRQSRAFVEKYHNADLLAEQLVTFYKEIIKKKQND